MPIFAFGSFVAVPLTEDAGFVESVPLTFSFYSMTLLLWAIVGGIVLLIARGFHRRDQSYRWTRYLVLLPGMIAAAALLILGKYNYGVFAIPLLPVTLLLLIWRWRLFRHWAAFVAAGLAVGFLTAACVMASLGGAGMILEFQTLLAACVLTVPLIIVRFVVRNGMTWPRLLLGALLGVAIPLAGAVVFTFIEFGGPSVYVLGLVPVILIGLLPFCVLIKWNRWCRDVATRSIW